MTELVKIFRVTPIKDAEKPIYYDVEPLVRCCECALYHSRDCVWNNAKDQDDYDYCSRAERAVIK